MNNAFQTYQIFFSVESHRHLAIGKLGTFDFPAGDYVYTGSARIGLEKRIARHLATEKIRRWHIDYLLTGSWVQITAIYLWWEKECCINQQTAGAIIVPRFGASDCRAGCGSHLKYLGAPLDDCVS